MLDPIGAHTMEDFLEFSKDRWDTVLHRVPDNFGVHVAVLVHHSMANARDGCPGAHQDAA